MNAHHTLPVRLPPAVYAQLRDVAGREANSVAAVIRRFVAAGLARERQHQP